MPVSDDTMVKIAEGLGTLNGALGQVIKHQDSMLILMQAHMIDQQAHSGVIQRVQSLEGTRKWFRRSMIAGAVTTPVAGAAQLGWVGKIIAILKAGSAIGGGQ